MVGYSASLRGASFALAKDCDEAIRLLTDTGYRTDRLLRHETLLTQVSFLAMTANLTISSVLQSVFYSPFSCRW